MTLSGHVPAPVEIRWVTFSVEVSTIAMSAEPLSATKRFWPLRESPFAPASGRVFVTTPESFKTSRLLVAAPVEMKSWLCAESTANASKLVIGSVTFGSTGPVGLLRVDASPCAVGAIAAMAINEPAMASETFLEMPPRVRRSGLDVHAAAAVTIGSPGCGAVTRHSMAYVTAPYKAGRHALGQTTENHPRG